MTTTELGYRILVRLKSNRKLYRVPVRTHKRGAPPKDGPLFQGKRPETHATAEEVWSEQHPVSENSPNYPPPREAVPRFSATLRVRPCSFAIFISVTTFVPLLRSTCLFLSAMARWA